MAGDLQPLERGFAIAKPDGTPTDYFIRWAQTRQIDISEGITAAQALAIIEAYLADHQLQAGSGIALSPSGNISDSPTIAAEVQAILDQVSTTWGSVLFRGENGWEALAPGTSGHFLKTNGSGADPAWAAGGGGSWWFLPPAAADFTLIGTVTPTLTDDTDVGLIVNFGAAATGDVYRGAVKTISSVTADWSVTIKVVPTTLESNYAGVGILLYDTVSARVIHFRTEFEGTAKQGESVVVNRGSYPSGFNSNPLNVNYSLGQSLFLRVRHINSGSTYKYDVSSDGKSWIEVFSESDTAWLTNRANRVGIGGFYNRSSGVLLASIPYWSQSGI